MRRCLLAVLAAVCALALPAAASADSVVVSGAKVENMAVLDDTIVWVTGNRGSQQLMRRMPDGTIGQVPGTSTASTYKVDLGRDADNDLVLTYLVVQIGDLHRLP